MCHGDKAQLRNLTWQEGNTSWGEHRDGGTPPRRKKQCRAEKSMREGADLPRPIKCAGGCDYSTIKDVR